MESLKKKYQKIKIIGEGTFAVIYEGISLETSKKVAIKKIKMGDSSYGIDIGALREIRSLQKLSHENIVNLIEVFSSKKNINLVLEFVDSDLEKLIRDRSVVFSAGDVKSWMWMLLKGVQECHSKWILHRDLKPNNLLIANDGTLKIADFGLARSFARPYENMTSQVVTRWYRAPELLFGSKHYSTAVDIWAVGCIFAELMLRVPFVAGSSDMEQLTTIFKALGTPTESEWPGLTTLPDYVSFPFYPKQPLKHIFTAADAETLDLLGKMLTFAPAKRITAIDALNHPYFKKLPYPTEPSRLPRSSTVNSQSNK